MSRRQKPAAQRAADGDTRKIGAKKLLAQIHSEPKAARGLPDCPQHLKGVARMLWNSLRDELIAMDQDRKPDATMLEGACVAYETAVYAYETIQKQGRLIAKRVLNKTSGEMIVVGVQPHPAVHMGNQAWILIRNFCAEFGLSPVSRTRLSIDRNASSTAAIDEEFARMLAQPRTPRTFPVVQ